MKGNLLIVGGGLFSNNAEIYNSFIAMSGGKKNAVIGIISAASEDPIESANLFKRDLIKIYNINENQIVIFQDFEENKNPINSIKNFRDITGLWFTGGDQRKIESILYDNQGKETYMFNIIADLYNRGCTIAGTSAGAAVLCNPMITGGHSKNVLFKFNYISSQYSQVDDNTALTLGRGLGFFEYGIIDQHFGERDRLGRLVLACTYSKKLGFGIDENTALIVDRKTKTIQVVGEGGVTVVDISNAKDNSKNNQIDLANIQLHYLVRGDSFNIDYNQVCITGEEVLENAFSYLTPKHDYIVSSSYVAFTSLIRNIFSNFNNTKYAFFNLEDSMNGYIVFTFTRKKKSKVFIKKINQNKKFSAKDIDLHIKVKRQI